MKIKNRLKRFAPSKKNVMIFYFLSTVWNVIDSMLNFESLIEKGIPGAVLVIVLALVWTVVVSFLSDILANHRDSNQIEPSTETNETELIGA